MPKHAETQTLPYTAEQMYDLVADVTRYPEFIPWTVAARVKNKKSEENKDILYVDLVVSFKVFRESFGSKVTLWNNKEKIETAYIDGPFKYLNSIWTFKNNPEGGCYVHFNVDFEFKNLLLQRAAGMFFHMAMQRIVSAFTKRAHALYG